MSNFNFQLPPRSIEQTSSANQSTASFGGSSLLEHVTPMLPQNNASYAPSQEPQLSTNQSIPLSGIIGTSPQISSPGWNSTFGQRSFQQDIKPIQGIDAMSDLSIGGMMKLPTVEQSEFRMSKKDFPALPGTQISEDSLSSGSLGLHDSNSSAGMDLLTESVSGNNNRGIQMSSDGNATNIPPSMISNQYGMVGLLAFIRAAQADPTLATLAMGHDLTSLGLDLNSEENLYPSFGGPFSDQPCLAHEIDFEVPSEYLVSMSLSVKLGNLVLKKYKDDLLFFLFYGNFGGHMQLTVAAELYSRNWRYHLEEKVWIIRAYDNAHYEKNGNAERGTFFYFDVQNWRRMTKEFVIDSSKLDRCPNLSAIVGLTRQRM